MSENLKCPFCGSRNTEMSFDTQIKRGLGHIAEFGIGFAAGYFGLGGLVEDSDINIADNVSRVWECHSCGKTWNPDNTPAVQQYKYVPSKPPTQVHKQKKEPGLKEREDRYRREFLNCLKDSKGGHISHADRETLDSLRDRLKLTGTCVAEIESNVLGNFRGTHLSLSGLENDKQKDNQDLIEREEQYRRACVKCLKRGEVKPGTRKMLNNLRDRLRLTGTCANEIEASVISEFKNTHSTYQKPETGSQYNENERHDMANKNQFPITNKKNEDEYIEALKDCLSNGRIAERERLLLDRIRVKCGISQERSIELEKRLVEPKLSVEEKEYFEAYKEVAVDNMISDKERRILDRLRNMLGITEERAKELEQLT